ncbi:MAG TPA: DMT family transporter [Candidatus Acidoferrales bacterium]|nr:DMT family transporter [Candidatus Acidoferrales bacterium]
MTAIPTDATPSGSSIGSVPAPKRPSTLALGLVLGLMLALWSFNYIAGKVALRHMDPISLACFRIELAAIIMLPIYFSRRRATVHMRDFWPFAYLGFFGVVVNQGLFTVGLNYTTSAHSAVIIAIGPIIVLLLARIMKLEAVTPAKVLGMAVAFAGVFLLEAENGSPAHSPFLAGDLITLCGTVGFAIYTVLGKRVAAEYDAIAMNTFNCVAAAIMLFPLTVRQGARLDWHAVGWSGWLGMIYMAAASSVAAYTIFYWVLGYLSASRVAAVSYFQPIAVILLSVAFLNEHPSRNLLLGTALVLLGVYLAERGTG